MKKILTLISIAFLIGLTAQAGLKEVKARMAVRLSAINKLKAAYVIGENNKGYLTVKGKITSVDQKTVDAENADRRNIYTLLAAKIGASLEKVQSRRAETIASKSKRDIWLQNPDGKWYKK